MLIATSKQPTIWLRAVRWWFGIVVAVVVVVGQHCIPLPRRRVCQCTFVPRSTTPRGFDRSIGDRSKNRALSDAFERYCLAHALAVYKSCVVVIHLSQPTNRQASSVQYRLVRLLWKSSPITSFDRRCCCCCCCNILIVISIAAICSGARRRVFLRVVMNAGDSLLLCSEDEP
jgi:hypothetical protein